MDQSIGALVEEGVRRRLLEMAGLDEDGTSDGAKKGWEKRKRGGGGPDERAAKADDKVFGLRMQRRPGDSADAAAKQIADENRVRRDQWGDEQPGDLPARWLKKTRRMVVKAKRNARATESDAAAVRVAVDTDRSAWPWR